MFKFSTSQVMINENLGEYFNLSVIKIGHNEPDVTVEVAVREPRLDVSLQGKLSVFVANTTHIQIPSHKINGPLLNYTCIICMLILT